MVIENYEFDDVYYSDLDNPISVISKFIEFLYKDNINDLIICVSCLHNNKRIIELHYQKELTKEFIFINSIYAGVGIHHFIIVVDDKNSMSNIQNKLIGMSLYEYYGDEWIRELLNGEVKKLYKTDSDGGFVSIYKNKKEPDKLLKK